MRARKAQNSQDNFFNEKYADDQFYGFSRGQFFVALTNQLNGQVHRDVSNSGFNEGQVVCNIFFPTDCVSVKSGKLPIYLDNGETKIFVPKTSTFFSAAEVFLTE